MRFSFLNTRLSGRLLAFVSAAVCALLCAAPCGAAPDDSDDPLNHVLVSDLKERGLNVPADNQTHPFGLRVLAKARRQIGTPYHLGTSTPGKGFDCSGLVWWVYQQHGVNIPRISTQQAKIGSPVSLANARAGDIIVFRTGRGPTGFHTGIVVDPGHFIHAPRTGKRVQEVALNNWWRTRLYTIRRVRGLKLPEHRMPSADEISLALENIYASEFSLKNTPASGDPLFSLTSSPESAVAHVPPPTVVASAPAAAAATPTPPRVKHTIAAQGATRTQVRSTPPAASPQKPKARGRGTSATRRQASSRKPASAATRQATRQVKPAAQSVKPTSRSAAKPARSSSKKRR